MPIDTFNQQKKSCHMGLSDCSSIYHMLTFYSAFQKRRLNIQSSSLCLHDTRAHENCKKSRKIQNTKKNCKNCNQWNNSYVHKIVWTNSRSTAHKRNSRPVAFSPFIVLWKHSACKGQSLHNVPPFLMTETGQDDVAWCCTYEKLKVLVLQVIANLEDFFESQRSWNNPWSFLLDFDTILYANLEDFFFSLEDGKKSMELGLDTRTYLPPDMSIHRMWKVEKINGKD